MSSKRGYYPLTHPPENLDSNKNGHFSPILGWETSCAGWSPLEPLLLSTSGPSLGDSEVVRDLIRFEGALGRRTGGATGRGAQGVVGLHRGLSGVDGEVEGGKLGRGGIGDDDEVLSHAESVPTLSHKVCMATGFLCFFPIRKVPPLAYKFGPEHIFTKCKTKRGRRVCIGGTETQRASRGGRSTLLSPSPARWSSTILSDSWTGPRFCRYSPPYRGGL